jgi:LPS O-antigen subunit length determinant protein (WzzB/FepE family)
MKKQIESDEIDFIKVFIDIWNNKLKIAAITIIFIALSIALYFINKPPIKAKTEILPITIFENNLYSSFNSIIIKPQSEILDTKNYSLNGLEEINGGYLLTLFIEELRTKKIIIKTIKKYQLLDRKKFDSEDKYLAAVEKKALKLNILGPVNVDGSKRGETRLNWTIEFELNDKDKWEEALSYIETEINIKIRKYIQSNFNSILFDLVLLNKFKLQDIDSAINSENEKFDKEIKKFEMDLGFKLEDIKIKINNAIKDYEVETKNRLAFLTEQAAIARTLDIKKNTIESQVFNTQNSFITNVKTDTPYYLRGYEAIEKNIQLIKNRTDKKSFVKNLFDLEKQKRNLEEDKTLERAERNKIFLEKILTLRSLKKNLLEDKTFERIQILFDDTPIVANVDFKAANIIYQNTKFETSSSLIKAVLFSGIFGVIFGMFYVLISSAIRQHK